MDVDHTQRHGDGVTARQGGASMLAPALTILLSSFLLFLVQPILAKQILPWFGGSAGVWTICLLFFQVVLLLGYGYAHWLTHHAGRRQYLVHVALLVASLATLPIAPGAGWRQVSGMPPELLILGLLTATVGLPYFLLSSTAPLLQRWLSASAATPVAERSIYRLFALSNFGSLAGLLCYPFVIEPFVSVHTQVWVWSCAYGIFVACSVGYALHRRRVADRQTGPAVPDAARLAPRARDYAYWVGCSALGSILLLAGTNQLTQNVASIPLLWIVPLSLYLLSFTLCFEGRSGKGWYERRVWLTPAMLATGAMAWALYADGGTLSVYASLPIFVCGIFLGCMVCHGELASSKPSPAHLTRFYLSIAVGGALGGFLVGIVAPQVFDGYWEMPLALMALASMGLYYCARESEGKGGTSWSFNVGLALVASSVVLLLLGAIFLTHSNWSKIVQGDAAWGCAALLLLAAALMQHYRLWRVVPLTALLCTLGFAWTYYDHITSNAVLSVRNFYGTLTVSKPDEWHVSWLKHGVIMHGSQVATAPQRFEPTTYYGNSSGVGRAILTEQGMGRALRIGAVGLGTGTLAAYGRPGDTLRIYELNPAVLAIAQGRFTYLSDSKARIEPVLGDARLSLELELARGAFDDAARRFDLLVLDAFSGDAIPAHLLTREAFATYARVLRPQGVMAFHVSNRYLDLTPVIERIARAQGYSTVLVADRPRGRGLVLASDWVLVTKSADFLRQPAIAEHSAAIVPRPTVPEWTDDFTSLFHILK